jgi:hypothetical protein
MEKSFPKNIWGKNKSAYPTRRIREVGPASINHLIWVMQVLSQPGLHSVWQKLLFSK